MALSARLVTSRILPRAQEQNLVVTIAAPSPVNDGTPGRPALSLAIVIDRSGSMHGAPIANAKAAALAVLRQLDPRDAFSVVTYSSSAETVIAIERATSANKIAARAAIETIEDDGGTCISCGLATGADEIARTPVTGGLRRILLISDGQANEGVYDRDELAQLAAGHAASGASISTVGVGLDFDEHTMRRLAEVGRGNYYFVEDTVALSQMFNRELNALSQTIASEVRLVAVPGPGVHIEEAYGYPMTRAGDSAIVPVADLRAGETRKVVFRVTLDAAHGSSRVISRIGVGWRRVGDAARRAAHATAEVDIVDDSAAVAASTEAQALQAVDQALASRALEDAAATYDNGDFAGAKQILERRSQAVRAHAAQLTPGAFEALDAISTDAIDGFAKAPAQAKKAASVKAYELAR
jgi:Ca-activated chloride channel family protein